MRNDDRLFANKNLRMWGWLRSRALYIWASLVLTHAFVALSVMAGLVLAIRGGTVPRLMAGTGPAMTLAAAVRGDQRTGDASSSSRCASAFSPHACASAAAVAQLGD